ncbi:multidrug resistance-associated protein 1 [Ixodes scapularis]|uniref:multidrug resistance-associated protein 1 n=1 Tax=Ixodes scapularis TaxID=6945 RepID=UPI001C3947F3|nr:multidrug resistance-associated protein 1 [Ixodes scapularis]
MTLLSPSARAAISTGQVLSILGVDCYQLAMSIFNFPYPVCGLLCMPIMLYLLACRVGTATPLCCAGYLLFVFLLPIPISRMQNFLWFRQMRARDERLKQTSDLLSSVRLVKMYAWEDAYKDKLLRARDVEMKPLFWVNVLDGLIDSIYSASSSVLIIIFFGTLAIFNPGVMLPSSVVFSCVYMIFITDVPMTQTSMALRVRSQTSLSLRRIVEFCTEEEKEEDQVRSEDMMLKHKGEVLLSNCDFTWTKPTADKGGVGLDDVSLHVKPGSLVGVVGFVGSGKSSLLAGILGDMHVTKGSVTCAGRIAYVPQIANVHNMSVQCNILYGKRMHPKNYSRVLGACQLHQDVDTFPAGDLTEVGEKGETLSGGQKQRISLARAAYNQADVYLLDDPLSALDAVVSRKVFKEVIGKNGILRNKTRIMACNQGSFLDQMDKLVLVHNRRIIVYDTLADLLNDPRAPETLRQGAVTNAAEKSKKEFPGRDMERSGEGANGRTTVDEVAESKKSAWQLIRALTRMSGPCIAIGLLAFLASAVALAWQLYLIRAWTRATSSSGSTEALGPTWIWVLAAVCVADVMCRVLGSILMAVAMRRLSGSLHRDMLSHVLSSPVPFFGSTPRGRIVNRFSVDLDHIDSRMYLSGKQFIQNCFLAVARVIVIGSQSPFVLAVAVVCIVGLVALIRLSLKASHAPKFLEAIHTSRLLSHVTETMDALSSIRAYGVLDRFCAHFCRLVDANMRAYWVFCMFYRFVRLGTSLFGVIIVLSTMLFAVLLLPPGVEPDPSTVGLTLSAASSILQAMAIMCIMMFTSLQTVVSFERCIEFTELPQESEVEPGAEKYDFNPDLPKAAEWPQEGKVEFVSYATSYKPGILPDVLKGITFTVNPSEKVGVVGRTGAGKSSLVMALLRVLKSSQGCIRIDGLDIAGVPLRKLRSGVTIIPQDPSLVRGSLRENLDPTGSHTDQEIWAALEQAHLKDVVARDPKGLLLDTGDGGSSFSVGQRQLVCLARALLRKPRLLVLDEATSQMDGDTDQLIQATLREAFAHCTQLTIAHRIHTVLDYDKILVMSDGRILEYGTVSDLLSNPSSVFRDMARDALIQTDSEK